MIEQEDVRLIFGNTDFRALRRKRILITGGTGFVGHWMAVTPEDVSIWTLNHIQYDRTAWDKASWDWIIHLANVPPDRVIACAKKCGASILYASSGSVMVDHNPGEYTLGKIAAEEALLGSGLDVRIARMFTFTGAHMKNHFAVVNFIMDALAGKNITIRSVTPRVTRSYLYAADMAVWMWRIITEGDPCAVYEVGSPHPVSMAELAREVQRNFQPRPLIDHDPVYTNEARPYYVPDTSRAQRQLGLEIYTPFDIAIAKTINHYRVEKPPYEGA